jgi:hypothetical protein
MGAAVNEAVGRERAAAAAAGVRDRQRTLTRNGCRCFAGPTEADVCGSNSTSYALSERSGRAASLVGQRL